MDSKVILFFDPLQMPNGDVYAAAMGGLEKVVFKNDKAVVELYPRQSELPSNFNHFHLNWMIKTTCGAARMM